MKLSRLCAVSLAEKKMVNKHAFQNKFMPLYLPKVPCGKEKQD